MKKTSPKNQHNFSQTTRQYLLGKTKPAQGSLLCFILCWHIWYRLPVVIFNWIVKAELNKRMCNGLVRLHCSLFIMTPEQIKNATTGSEGYTYIELRVSLYLKTCLYHHNIYGAFELLNFVKA